jgi:hypothetical protein
VYLSCEPAQVLYLFVCMGFALTLWFLLSFYQPLRFGCQCEFAATYTRDEDSLDSIWVCAISRYSVELSRSGRGEFTMLVTVTALVGLAERDAHMR